MVLSIFDSIPKRAHIYNKSILDKITLYLVYPEHDTDKQYII